MPFDIHAFLIEVSYKFGEGLLSTHLADLSVSLLKASGAYGADTWPEPYGACKRNKPGEVKDSTGLVPRDFPGRRVVERPLLRI